MCLSGLGPSVAGHKHRYTHTHPYGFLPGKTWFLDSFFFLSPFSLPPFLSSIVSGGKEIRGRLRVMSVKMISKLVSLSVARMGGCLYASLQGMKEAPKDKRQKNQEGFVGSLAVGEGPAKRVADQDGRPGNLPLQLCFACVSGRKIGRFRINYCCEWKHREMYDKDLNIALQSLDKFF